MGKVCDRYCHGCVYYQGWFDYNACCNYILVEGESRKCDPGKGCTKMVKRKRRRKSQRRTNDGRII